MMNGQPNFTLGIEYTTQIAPCNGERWTRFYCFEVTSLYDQHRKRNNRLIHQQRIHLKTQPMGQKFTSNQLLGKVPPPIDLIATATDERTR